MGTGIGGAILLEFIAERGKEKFAEYSVSGFFDNYERLPERRGSAYEQYAIRDDILIPNYANFLTEFYTLIYDKFEGIRPPAGEIPVENYTKQLLSCKTREEFNAVFNGNIRNSAPYIDSISCRGTDRNVSLIFYLGSYKAVLEEYSTFTHIEKILVKAMNNPLKTAVKFGIYG